MPYQPDTIANVVKRLNQQYFLPAIQREFVWKPEQIIQLFDSIMRGYPISSFLFWELTAESRDKWDIYEFIRDFRQGGTHNPPANTDGVNDLTLVLDGQQRLTSLMIGLRGTYTIKKPNYRWNNPAAWVKHTLYLDLLKDARVSDDDLDIGLRYGFRFLQAEPEQDEKHYWFKVGNILNFASADAFDDFLFQERAKLPQASTTLAQANTFERNLRRLRKVIWEDASISYYTERDQDYDRVLDIFVRANEGGTKLSKSDLLLSMVTARWTDMNAREEIYGFVDEINTNLTRKNNFDKDFVMKCCLVLTGLPVKYMVENFTNANLARIQQQWDPIKIAVRKGVDLANSYGIDRDTLSSTNALIPVLYWLYRHPQADPRHGTTPADGRNASLIRHWLLMALVNNVFGLASDGALTITRQVMDQQLPDSVFPANAISDELAKSSRLTRFDDLALANVLDIEYSDRQAFLALSLLYDDNAWGTTPYHIDHIFPQSLFKESNLAAAGIPLSEWEDYRALKDRIGNLELLSGPENIEKSNQDFGHWLERRRADFIQRHLIPTDASLYSLARFQQFIQQREALIRERLQTLFAPIAVEERYA